jgi:hypothetical protein
MAKLQNRTDRYGRSLFSSSVAIKEADALTSHRGLTLLVLWNEGVPSLPAGFNCCHNRNGACPASAGQAAR